MFLVQEHKSPLVITVKYIAPCTHYIVKYKKIENQNTSE